jgi:signal transduction histidine kinase
MIDADFDKRLEAAKLEAMAEFAAGAGHEINNPIAVIAGRAQLLLEGESHPQRRRELAVIHSQAMRVYEMIADMMLFARPPTPKRVACDVVALAQTVAAEVAGKSNEGDVQIVLETNTQAATVYADENQLAVALRAILENALNAVERGGHIRLRTEAPAGTSNIPGVAIIVADDGPGISAEVREHLFDPFYCGRQAGRGLGMGLSKAWRIVTNHGGHIEVKSEGGRGAEFTIVMPAAL